ncbi:MAG: sulfur carrier protein ThiS [Bacteroidales bacterium]|nr:sulfur carrier protein ThiS [Bacteroidales bacterium]
MKILLNKESFELKENATLADLLKSANINEFNGIAIAVNNSVVRRDNWNNTMLKDGDKVTIIKAVCGG